FHPDGGSYNFFSCSPSNGPGGPPSAPVGTARTPRRRVGNDKTPFTDSPRDGAVLVGFDLALAPFLRDKEVIYALRPVYRTASGEIASQDYGRFADAGRAGPDKNAPRGRITRTVRLRARPGYAVAGVTLRTGVYIHGRCGCTR